MFHPSRMATKEERERAGKKQERKAAAQRELRDTLAKASFDKRLFDVTQQNPEALGNFLSAHQGNSTEGSAAGRTARSGSWAPALPYEKQRGDGSSPTRQSEDDGLACAASARTSEVGLCSYTLPVLRKIKPSSNVMIDGALATDGTPYADPPAGFIKSIFRTNLNNSKAVTPRGTSRSHHQATTATSTSGRDGSSYFGGTENDVATTTTGAAATARAPAPPPFTHHASKPRSAKERIDASVAENAVLIRAEPYAMRNVRSAFRENVDRLPQMSARKLESPRKKNKAEAVPPANYTDRAGETTNDGNTMSSSGSRRSPSFSRQPMSQAELSLLLSRPKVSSAARKKTEEETYRPIPKPPGGFAEDRGRDIPVNSHGDGPSSGNNKAPFRHMTRQGGSRIPEIASGYFGNPVGGTIREVYEDPLLSTLPSRDSSRRPFMKSPPKSGGLIGKPCYQAL